MTKPTSEKRSRLPRLRRAEKKALPPFRLTARDLAILAAVYEYRLLSSKQIVQLLFDDRANNRASQRLKRLFHYGYLGRLEQAQVLSQGSKPFVYYLDTAGAQALAHVEGREVEDLDWNPRDYQLGHHFLDHLLASNDVRVAITLAAKQHGFTIETWLDERTLKSSQMKDVVNLTGPKGRTQQAAVVPDGYLCLNTGAHRYHQFLEIDLRTVTGASREWGRRTWARKVAAYLAYYRSGKYQERYQTKSMRILTITVGEGRLKNLKEITEQMGGKSRFWFTTFDKITPATVLTEPIWQKAGTEGLFSLTW